jgi:hypothetical protein
VPGRRGTDDHHLAVLANDVTNAGATTAARRLADVLALALVADQDGCRRPIRPPDGGTSRRTPERRICTQTRNSRR